MVRPAAVSWAMGAPSLSQASVTGGSPRFTAHTTLTRSPSLVGPKLKGLITGGSTRRRQPQGGAKGHARTSQGENGRKRETNKPKPNKHQTVTIDVEGGGVAHAGGVVGGRARVVAGVQRRQVADREDGRVQVEVADLHAAHALRRHAVLRPRHLQGRVPAVDRALHRHALAQGQVAPEGEAAQLWWHCDNVALSCGAPAGYVAPYSYQTSHYLILHHVAYPIFILILRPNRFDL